MPGSQIPPPRQKVVDQQGLMTTPWYRFLAPLQQTANLIEAGGGLTFTNNILAVEPNGITNAMLRQSVASSIIGRQFGTAGNVADIIATGDRRVLGRQDGVVGFFDTAQVRAIDTQALKLGVRAVTANSTYTFSDFLIVANATGGNITLTLPTLEAGRMVVAKKTDASANSVTISGAVNIDGAASKSTTTQYETFRLIGGASEWHMV